MYYIIYIYEFVRDNIVVLKITPAFSNTFNVVSKNKGGYESLHTVWMDNAKYYNKRIRPLEENKWERGSVTSPTYDETLSDL